MSVDGSAELFVPGRILDGVVVDSYTGQGDPSTLVKITGSKWSVMCAAPHFAVPNGTKVRIRVPADPLSPRWPLVPTAVS